VTYGAGLHASGGTSCCLLEAPSFACAQPPAFWREAVKRVLVDTFAAPSSYVLLPCAMKHFGHFSHFLHSNAIASPPPLGTTMSYSVSSHICCSLLF